MGTHELRLRTSSSEGGIEDFWTRKDPNHERGSLCAKCQALFSDATAWHEVPSSDPFQGPPFPEYTSHAKLFRTLGDIQNHADRGCQLCVRFRWNMITDGVQFSDIESQYRHTIPGPSISSKSYDDLAKELELLVLCVWWEEDVGKNFEVFVYAQSDVPVRLHCIVRVDLATFERTIRMKHVDSVSPRKACEWMQARLIECLRDHKECGSAASLKLHRFHSSDFLLPGRLLELSHHSVQLVHTTPLTKRIDYATLSHRWEEDTSKEILLTRSTKALLLAGMPTGALPLLFQDVVHLVLRLGISYLWIDTMCIIQDDPADWAAHVTTMSFIYASSSLNLCASAGSHHQHLLRAERNRLLYVKFGIEPIWTTFSTAELIADSSYPSDTFRPGDHHVLSRGWVFQERLLAPRLLFVTNEQVWWFCREKCAAELSESAGQQGTHLQAIFANLFSQDDLTPDKLLEVWFMVVEGYSCTTTTYEKDRLFAIAGIAAMLKGLWKQILPSEESTYHAGMWRHQIWLQLCWRSTVSITKRAEYRAPSWSWASVNNHVSFGGSSSTGKLIWSLVDIPVDGVETQPKSTEYGPCQSGTLIVRCNLCRVRIYLNKNPITGWTSSTAYHAQIRRDASGTATERPTDSRELTVYLDDPSDPGHEMLCWAAAQSRLFLMPLTISSLPDQPHELSDVSIESRGGPDEPNGSAYSPSLDTDDLRPHVYLSNMHLDLPEIFERNDWDSVREKMTVRKRFDFDVSALLLQRVSGVDGQYSRVGLMTYSDSWNVENGVSMGSEFSGIFENTNLKAEAGEILRRPIPELEDVYEIKII